MPAGDHTYRPESTVNFLPGRTHADADEPAAATNPKTPSTADSRPVRTRASVTKNGHTFGYAPRRQCYSSAPLAVRDGTASPMPPTCPPCRLCPGIAGRSGPRRPHRPVKSDGSSTFVPWPEHSTGNLTTSLSPADGHGVPALAANPPLAANSLSRGSRVSAAPRRPGPAAP